MEKERVSASMLSLVIVFTSLSRQRPSSWACIWVITGLMCLPNWTVHSIRAIPILIITINSDPCVKPVISRVSKEAEICKKRATYRKNSLFQLYHFPCVLNCSTWFSLSPDTENINYLRAEASLCLCLWKVMDNSSSSSFLECHLTLPFIRTDSIDSQKYLLSTHWCIHSFFSATKIMTHLF